MLNSHAVCQKYYEILNIPEDKRNVATLLLENAKAIKAANNILRVFRDVIPKEYPYSFKKIKTGLLKRIRENVGC